MSKLTQDSTTKILDVFAPDFADGMPLPLKILFNKKLYMRTLTHQVADFDRNFEKKLQFIKETLCSHNVSFYEDTQPYYVASYRGILTNFSYVANEFIYNKINKGLENF